MADSRDQEPSIEEILASIREIISDDDAEAAAAPAPAPDPAPAADEPAPQADIDEIMDLSAFEAKKDALSGIDLEKPKEMVVDFTDPEPEPEPEPEPISASLANVAASTVVDTPVEPMSPDESLLTDHAKTASMDSLTRLAQNIAISRAGQGGTLEDIVREMIRPMLRDWLDRNLPPMIERMVERELERLVKEAMNR